MNGVYFTPDSRALIICRGDAFTFWDLETLQPIRRLARDVALYPGYVAFSPDGKLMALEMAPAIIYLMEVATGRTVAKLQDPHGDRAGWLDFTPDGTRLVVVAKYAKAVHVWDLLAMRQRLKGMGLDWNWPEFPRNATAVRVPELTRLEVLPGDLGKYHPMNEPGASQVIARYRREVAANPNSATACNELAWIYLTGPTTLRDVKAALPLAENAVRLEAGNAEFRNTLGVAYYRTGRYREAIELLRANLEKQDDAALAIDLYFLAMCHHRLGESARARDYLAWAIRWTKAQKDLPRERLDELTLFRTEAEELLGTKQPP